MLFLLKFLFIAMSFAVCIDRSFQGPVAASCVNLLDCLEKIHEYKLYEGFVPIIVSHPEGNSKAEMSIFTFFSKTPLTKLLIVNVQGDDNVELAQYLNRYRRNELSYPFVAAIHDNILIHHLSLGYDQNALNTFLTIAKNPNQCRKNNSYFVNDICKIMNNINLRIHKQTNGQWLKIQESQEPGADTSKSQKQKKDDIRFNDPEIINCVTPVDCLGKVRENKLYHGFVPIVVTHPRAKKWQEDMIFEFFKKHTRFTKILRVNVDRNMNVEMAQYLHHFIPGGITYPFVTAINGNKLIHHVSLGFDQNALNDFVTIAKSPDQYMQNTTDFTRDISVIIKQTNPNIGGSTLGKRAPEPVSGTWPNPTKPNERIENLQKRNVDDVFMIESMGYLHNWNSSLHMQKDLHAAALNINDKPKGSHSTPSSGQTEPDQKKRKGKMPMK